MGGATPVLLKVSLFIKVGVATLKTLPRPILFLFQIALYQGFPMMYHLFHNSMWKVVRIAKTSDCKTLLILKWPPLYMKLLRYFLRAAIMPFWLYLTYIGKIYQYFLTIVIPLYSKELIRIALTCRSCRKQLMRKAAELILHQNTQNSTYFVKV